jgi:chromate transporter
VSLTSNLFKLFWVFFKIGAFTFGGGYAMIPLIQDEVCKRQKWTSDDEFLDIVAISQSLPGALAINTSAVLGYKLYGIPGIISAALGAVLPSFLSIFIVAVLLINIVKYTPGKLSDNPISNTLQRVFMGVRPAVVALIAVSVVKLGKNVGFSLFNLVVAVVTIVLLILNVNPIIALIAAAVIGLASLYIGGRHNVKDNN